MLEDLKALVEKYNVQDKFGFHLVHGHLQVDSGHIMLGHVMSKLDACWARLTEFKCVDRENIHGHIKCDLYDELDTICLFREQPSFQLAT